MWSRWASTPPRSPPNHSMDLRPAARRQLIPAAPDCPGRWVVAGTGRRETVGKDLVHHRSEVPCGSSGIEREHEVVGIGHVVPNEAESVQPRVAELAARQEPPVANLRVPNPKAGSPRACSVPLCRDSAALAVLDPAQCNGLDVTGNVNANDCFASELGRSLEDIDVRTIVVRFVEE